MKIALIAYLDNNIGDDLMVKLIAERYKDSEFLLFSDKSIVSKTFNFLPNIKVLPKNSLKEEIKRVDLVVYIGGSIFILNSLRRVVSRIPNLINMIKWRIKRIPIITIGCNFGPYNRLGKIFAFLEISLNNLIIARDNEYFEDYKKFVSSGKIVFSHDFVYNLNFLKKNNIKKDNILGISAYRSVAKKENNDLNYTALAKIADNFLLNGGAEVRIFAFDSEDENDLSAAHHIFDRIIDKSRVKIVPYLGNIDEFLNTFSSCELFVSIRFHSAVLADIFNINFFPLAYSNKMRNLIADRYPDFVVESTLDLSVDSNSYRNLKKFLKNKKGCLGNNIPIGCDIYFEKINNYIK